MRCKIQQALIEKHIAVLLALILAFSLSACMQVEPEKIAPIMCGYSVRIADMNEATERMIVATCGDHALTTKVFQFFYWLEYIEFHSGWSGAISEFGIIDTQKPLALQLRTADFVSWQEYFIEKAMAVYWKYQVLIFAAEMDKGYTVSEDGQQMLEKIEDNLTETSLTLGYQNADEMLKSTFFETATLKGYLEYYKIFVHANDYYDYLQRQTPVTDEDVNAFYDAHAQEYQENGVYKNDSKAANLLQILIYPNAGNRPAATEEDWKAAKESVREIMGLYEAGEPSAEDFLALAQEYTQSDLYLNEVYEGKFGGEIDAWCFQSGRQVGDVGLVRSDYGWHLLYLSSFSEEPYWKTAAHRDYIVDQQEARLAQLYERYPQEIFWENIRLTDINLPEDR